MAKAAPRTVLITGCSSGIGLCMAVQLARDPERRFHVIATMRDLRKKDKLESAAGDTLNQTLTIQRLDVCSDESVAECINSLPEKQLDVLGVPFNDVYAASKFAIEGFCESLAVQLLKFNIFISLVEPGPINTEFEMKLMEEVAKSQFPGVDATTVHYFKEIYLPASHEIFTTMGQSPESVAKAVVNVIAKERPPFRTQTNPLYTPLVALKYADTSGELSVSTYYNLLFRFTRLFYISTSFLKCITCRCFRRQITPT
ncbi:retinol dehydrogenase 8-like [Protobothrops mucrosquamatus]|uniref:retinol dehydrogenase 8-like n=1 Tax=Protobothrops mucrosquamatus TaxID=103944 RepID=UPI000775C898|nr:retinol dehydrogenase 8-like [Protobothrops mucrosquamatus]